MKRITLLVLSCCLLLTGCNGKNIEDVVDDTPKANNVVLLPPPSAEQENETLVNSDNEQKVERVERISIEDMDEDSSKSKIIRQLDSDEIESLYEETLNVKAPDNFTLVKSLNQNETIKFGIDVNRDYSSIEVSDKLNQDGSLYIYKEGETYIYNKDNSSWSVNEGIYFEDMLSYVDSNFTVNYYFVYPLVEDVYDMQHHIWTYAFGISDEIIINKRSQTITNAFYTEQNGTKDIIQIEYVSNDGYYDIIIRFDEKSHNVIYLKSTDSRTGITYEITESNCKPIDIDYDTLIDFEENQRLFKKEFWNVAEVHNSIEYNIECDIEDVDVYDLSLASDESVSTTDMRINDIVRDTAKIVSNRYTDLDSDLMQKAILNIEDYLNNKVSNPEINNIFSDDKYSIKYSCLYSSIPPQSSENFKEVEDNVFLYESSNSTVMIKFYIKGTEVSNETNCMTDNDWFVVSVDFYKTFAETASMIVFGGYNCVETPEGFIKIPVGYVNVNRDDNTILGELGHTVTVDFINSEGLIEYSAQATHEASPEDSKHPWDSELVFTEPEIDAVNKNYLKAKYIRVNLPSGWKKEIFSNNGQSTMIPISEIRLVLCKERSEYAMTTWSDVDAKTTEGYPGNNLTSDFLAKTSIN